ncbi:MAG: zinc-binding dehydrogenase [Planctomycetota bacterium]
MRCLQITAINAPPTLVELPDPSPGTGEVVVRLKAAALNHRDVWIQLGKYPGLTLPVIPGSDGAGIVVAAASGQESWIGKQVVINPGFGWGPREDAQDNAFTILGMPRAGTLSTHVVVPASQLSEKPAHLSWPEAAALPLAGLTAWRALVGQGKATSGTRVVITGIGGGVALAALQFARALGCQVAVTSADSGKRKRATELGATLALDRADATWPKQVLAQWTSGADLVIDGGGGDALNQAIDCLRPGGSLVIYGATGGVPQSLDLRKVFWRQLRIQGSTMGSPAEWTAMLVAVSRYGIRPIVDSALPLAQGAEAFVRMQAGKQFGKLVFTCE